jgi:hypothetical protein
VSKRVPGIKILRIKEQSWNPYLRGRICTFDLLVLTSSDQPLLILTNIFFFPNEVNRKGFPDTKEETVFIEIVINHRDQYVSIKAVWMHDQGIVRTRQIDKLAMGLSVNLPFFQPTQICIFCSFGVSMVRQ